MALLATVAPIGTVALVIPLARHSMSGTTPNRSTANGAPSRPKPLITSSKISNMPCLVQISRNRCR